MKKFLLIFLLSFIVCQINAQSSKLKLPAQNTIRNGLQVHAASPEPEPQPRIQNTVYLPANERDSVYDIPTATWFYDRDVYHTYYKGNCLDSVEVITVNGYNDTRITHKYDRNYQVYYLQENWNGGAWVNSAMEIDSIFPNNCWYNYIYLMNWNGTGWDTVGGSRRTVSAGFVGSNPTFLERQRIINGAWTNYYKYLLTYDGSGKMTSWTYQKWDASKMTYENLFRYTNYNYFSYSSTCEYAEQSYEYQDWDGTQWQNSFKIVNNKFPADTVYSYSWNGSSYVFDWMDRMLYDSENNNTGTMSYVYDTLTSSWNYSGADYHVYTYGPNKEIIRDEYFSSYYYSPDSLFPISIKIYSNFTPCVSSVGIDEKSADRNIGIYPNPMGTHSVIQLDEHLQDADFRIFDAMGREVFHSKMNGDKMVLPKGDLTSGIYLVTIHSDQKLKLGRLVVE